MNDCNDILKTLKLVASEVVENCKMTDVFLGTVESTTPLRVKMNKNLVLFGTQLILTRNVSDYECSMAVNNGTKNTYKVFNALLVGEVVVLLRMKGGQKFVVLDRA